MVKGVIYSNISPNHKVAMGYLDWYKSHYKYMSTDMFQHQYDPETLLKIQQRLENEKFHFAARIRKTHHVNIPVDVIMMKMKGFLREIADKVIEDQNKPIQLEFDFGDGGQHER